MIVRGNGRVTVGYLYPDVIEGNFHNCYQRLMNFDRHRPRGEPLIAHAMGCVANSGGIVSSRNEIVRQFLDETDDEWLQFFDADMGFAPDTVDRLILAAGDPIERPIIGGLCFSQKVVADDIDELGCPAQGFYYEPTIYHWQGEGFTAQSDYERDAIVECDATGAACLLIHRHVLETLRAEHEGPWHWFDSRALFGKPFGEDVLFCARANKAGFPIYVDTSIKTSHKKSIYLTEDTVPVLQGLRRDAAPEPRTLEIVPQHLTLNRAARRRKARR